MLGAATSAMRGGGDGEGDEQQDEQADESSSAEGDDEPG